MALELNIKPEDIEALVRDSIMRSGFGKAVTDAVAKVMSGYNNPIEAEVTKYVGTLCGQLVREKCGDQIKAACVVAIEARVTTEFIEAVVAAATNKMIQAAKEGRY